jgi:lipoic acid synthetase
LDVYTDTPKMPSWLRKELSDSKSAKALSRYLEAGSAETVCVNSRCPNINECYSAGNVSFLILGKTCTRNCLFCAIGNGAPEETDPAEPAAVAKAVSGLGLKYAVITSVTRDDIPDGGAGMFADVVRAVKKASPETIVETLVPDFNGSLKAIDKVIEADVDVFSHNMETVQRLYPQIRPDFDYSRSLSALRHAASSGPAVVKSGFMAGLGESEGEISGLLRDIKDTGCGFLTIGQYLKPKNSRLEVKEYIRPERFSEMKEEALKLGFKKVASGPFVRSSYRAGDFFANDLSRGGLNLPY